MTPQSHIFKNFGYTFNSVLKQLEDEKAMVKNLITFKKDKSRMFQVLLLDYNYSEDVEVEEAEHVDFKRVEEHLADCGSVFITSKRSQKIAAPRDMRHH